jgi:alpha-beta hydrolase superfamily lysophospholipase
LVAQNYIQQYGDVDGCILSGSRAPGGFMVRAALPLMTALALFGGQRRASPLARALADGRFNNYFRPARTPFDWLSRDEAAVDAYVKDPCCGFLCSAGFYRDLFRGLCRLSREEEAARIRKDLPVYVFAGSQDPAGDMGAGPTALVKRYRTLGIEDLEFVLYPGARHETLNETNRDEVMKNLLSWIDRRRGAVSAGDGD